MELNEKGRLYPGEESFWLELSERISFKQEIHERSAQEEKEELLLVYGDESRGRENLGLCRGRLLTDLKSDYGDAEIEILQSNPSAGKDYPLLEIFYEKDAEFISALTAASRALHSTSKYEIYTDGACTGNPGPGGYAALIIQEGKVIEEITGCDPDTTNNRMELSAVIAALEWAEPGSSVKLYSDSQYVVKGLKKWMETWKQNGWQTSSNNPVKNRDLWERLDELRQDITLNVFKVPAHSGHELNERVDSLAKNAIRGGKIEDERYE